MIDFPAPEQIAVALIFATAFLLFLSATRKFQIYFLFYLIQIAGITSLFIMALIAFPILTIIGGIFVAFRTAYRSLRALPSRIDDYWSKNYG